MFVSLELKCFSRDDDALFAISGIGAWRILLDTRDGFVKVGWLHLMLMLYCIYWLVRTGIFFIKQSLCYMFIKFQIKTTAVRSRNSTKLIFASYMCDIL